MATTEIDRSTVLVLDETPEQFYLDRIVTGVDRCGKMAIALTDLELALEEVKYSNIGAVIATANPRHPRNERLESANVPTIPLLKQANRLEVPLAIVSEHPLMQGRLRPNSPDTLVSGSLKDIRTLPARVSEWLIKQSTDENFNKNTVPDQETVGRRLFGSKDRLAIGTWIVKRDPEDGDFCHKQVTEAVNLKEAVRVLGTFVSLGMLQSEESGRFTFYRQLPSPLWDIFKVASEALINPTT
jgi:hypothetical protein